MSAKRSTRFTKGMMWVNAPDIDLIEAFKTAWLETMATKPSERIDVLRRCPRCHLLTQYDKPCGHCGALVL